MAAPVLLSDYKMKKTLKRKHPIKESEIPVDLATMREFRAEIVGKIDGLALRMDSFEKRMDAFEKRMDAFEHRMEAFEKRMDSFEHRMEAFEKRMDSFEDRMRAFELKMDSVITAMMGLVHEHKLLLEESRLRNKQAYDGYIVAYEKIHNLESRIRPECLKD